MHYQLFFQGRFSSEADALRSAGLGDFAIGAKGVPCVLRDVPGLLPGDCPGLLVGWGREVGSVPERQTVVDVGADYRLVLWTDSPVTPEELERAQLFFSWDTALADGQKWKVPIAAELPSDFRLVDRQWTKIRKPAFAEFWRQSEVWFRRESDLAWDMEAMLADSGQTEAEFYQDLCEFCLLALRQNYRITGPIASHLGLFDSSILHRIVFNVTDGMPRQEVQKLMAEQIDRETAGLVEKKEDLGLSIPA
jgi:hypothetical protein